ncbi:MAG: 3'-5' exonuclease [Planctomycetes bacterium]|nr:3'-5' exonuclease [Planctomycetota bacterium]
MKLLVVDTETGGTDPRRHSLLTVGAVVWDQGEIGEELGLRVLERELVVDPEAMAINRIDLAEHHRDALEPRLAAIELVKFVERNFVGSKGPEPAVVCGHNVAFDVAFLKRLFEQAELPYDKCFSHRTLDTASVLRFLALAGRIPAEWVGSSKAFAHFGIRFSRNARHTATADARATARLLNRLLDLERKGV